MTSKIVRTTSFFFLFALTLFVSNMFAQGGFTVSAGAAGPVKIGMTVAEAKKAMPEYDFERTSDGEGIALIAVELRKSLVFTFYSGEEDPEKPVDYTKVIEHIEIWSPEYSTEEGIGPGTPIADAEKKYGALKEIMKSEIEAREYAEFATGPKDITFRVEGAGIFDEDSRKTSKYRPGSKIRSLIIAGDGTETNVGFYSSYSDLEKECKTPEGQGAEGGHISTYCEGPDDYRVHIFDTAMSMEITVEAKDSGRNISVAGESLSFTTKGKKLEWRYKNGVPFAVILRGNKYKTEDGLIKYPVEVTGEYLFVRGLPGYESINSDVNVRTAKFANEEARKIAAEGYVKVKFANKDYLSIDTAEYNSKIVAAANAKESWVKSPMQVALKLVGDFVEMSKRKMVFDAPRGEDADSFILTVVNDGLLDDSVKGEKLVFELIREPNGVWKISSAKKSWGCWPGRGHEDFSAVLCS